MKQENPLFYLFKNYHGLLALSLLLYLFLHWGITGLLVPLFTGKLVDKFSFDNMNWMFVAGFISIFIVNALLSGVGLYLLSKIGEKVIYAIRSVLWHHIIHLKMPFLPK